MRIDEPDKLYGVSVRKPDDEALRGVGDLGAVDGFWYNAAKTKSTVVLTAKYFRFMRTGTAAEGARLFRLCPT